MTQASVVSYADDTNTHVCGSSTKEMKEKLEDAAREVLHFICVSKFSDNPEKTKFGMFVKGRKSCW